MFINLITGAKGGGGEAAASLVNISNTSKAELSEIYNYIKSNVNEEGEYSGSKWFTYTYGYTYSRYNYIATKIKLNNDNIQFYFLNSDGFSDFDFIRIDLNPSGSIDAPYELPITVDLYGGLVILPSNLTLSEADKNISYEIQGGKNAPYRIPYDGKYYLMRIRVNNTVAICKVTNANSFSFEIDFEIDGYSYHYQTTSNGGYSGKLTFVSKTPLPNGNINSSEVSNIKVLTQAEYDAIDPKDEKTLYMIKG